MNDAQKAIADIEKAVNVYGSNAKLIKKTKTGYLPASGQGYSEEEVEIKCFFKNSKSANVNFIGDYERVLVFYTDRGVTKEDEIEINNVRYKIVHIEEAVLQDTTIKYEVLIK